jgi:hypothetical protein
MAEVIISNIMRDKTAGWSSNYYNHTSTVFDLPLARAEEDRRLNDTRAMAALQATQAAALADARQALEDKAVVLDKALIAAIAAKEKVVATFASKDAKAKAAYLTANPTAEADAVAAATALSAEDSAARKEQLETLQTRIIVAKAAVEGHKTVDLSDLMAEHAGARRRLTASLALETAVALVDLRIQQQEARQTIQKIQNARAQFMEDGDEDALADTIWALTGSESAW